MSTDGTRVAYAWARGGDVKVAVRLTRSGRKLDTTTFAGRSTELVGFGKRRPLMTRWRNPATFWYSPATGDRERIADKQAWRVDVKRNRISLAIPVDQGGYDGYCLRYAKLSTPQSRAVVLLQAEAGGVVRRRAQGPDDEHRRRRPRSRPRDQDVAAALTGDSDEPS